LSRLDGEDYVRVKEGKSEGKVVAPADVASNEPRRLVSSLPRALQAVEGEPGLVIQGSSSRSNSRSRENSQQTRS